LIEGIEERTGERRGWPLLVLESPHGADVLVPSYVALIAPQFLNRFDRAAARLMEFGRYRAEEPVQSRTAIRWVVIAGPVEV
jgi:hypothetical protein